MELFAYHCNKISNGRVQKVPHISYLFEHFPDFGLEDNENADESGFAKNHYSVVATSG